MAEKVTAGPITSANGVREAVCIHTKKIFSSCKDKDCIEDLTFYPTATAQSVIDASQSIRGGRVELLHVGVDVEPVSFNRGFFTVDMRFYYRVILQAVNNGMRATEIEGLATFDKRVMLFGGESRAKVFSSYPVPGGADYPIDLTANLPTAVVSAVDPLAAVRAHCRLLLRELLRLHSGHGRAHGHCRSLRRAHSLRAAD